MTELTQMNKFTEWYRNNLEVITTANRHKQDKWKFGYPRKGPYSKQEEKNACMQESNSKIIMVTLKSSWIYNFPLFKKWNLNILESS